MQNERIENFKNAVMKNPLASALAFIIASWFTLAGLVNWAEANYEGHNINGYWDSVWWGIVTLLTVGYGDRFPVSPTGRLFGGILMACGVVGIAIVTAKISSFFLERALREGRGVVDSKLLNNHYVICGWKDDMSGLLMHVLESNKELSASQLVLVNNVEEKEIENLLAIPRLKELKVIRGEFWLEVNLRRAAPERAKKVIILADATPSANGEIPTVTEADARTIMTAMTLNNVAKGTPIIAEILDSVMDQYLKIAHVHEIIYSRDTSRLMVAMGSTGTGVTNIFQELLNPKSGSVIATQAISENLFHLPYAEFSKEFSKQNPNQTLIGILENSGNSHQAKEIAIRRAQQTPNIAQLVSNLQSVKALKFNQPIFNPAGDYVIAEGSMAIVIATKKEEAKV
jgi:voltage-gated potassium channel